MNIQKIINSLSPHERKILLYIEEEIVDICKKSNLDKIAVLRALDYLQNKKIVSISYTQKKIIEIGVNGALYKKKGLPERRLLNLLDEKRIIPFQEAQKESGLSQDEFKASLGALKKKAVIELKNGKIIFNANKEEISKKSIEEIFIETLPLDYDSLTPEQLHALKILQNRRDIVQIKEEKSISIKATALGKILIKSKIKETNLIEQVTPKILEKEAKWKHKKFRIYDVTSPVPKIYGGKRHFVNQAIDYAKRIWTDMGFKEMSGNMIQSSFWNFDALFTAQDHPVREMQDTFFINKETELPNKSLVKNVKLAHEKGTKDSKGWRYRWNKDVAKKLVLRTHTTCLSAQTLSRLKKDQIPAKFFSLGKCFRNETIDWNHGFEFNQTEGIVVDRNATFRHLIGYLKQFAKKMGFEKIRFRPAYFPYTEPSLEGDVWDSEKKEWIELLAAGILRPEVTTPLLGEAIPVLAWGPGFDRMIMKNFGIKDFREIYKNDITQLRNMKFWIK